jgi:AcrR family transcriptional regulator
MSPNRRRPYPRRMRAAERREQLLDVTLDLIAEHGFQAVTIDAVAREAGITRPVVYGLFDDLSGLLHALVDREEDRALDQLARAIPRIPDDDPDALLLDGLRTFFEAVLEAPKTWRLIVLPVEGKPQVLRERVERDRNAVLRQLERLVEWGVDARGGPEGLDAELFARILVTVAEDGARLLLTDPENFTIDRYVTMADVILKALPRTREASDVPPPPLGFEQRAEVA